MIKNICNFDNSKTEPYFYKNTLKALQTKTFKILFALSFTLLINTIGYSQDIPKTGGEIKPSITNDKDSINISSESLSKLSTTEIDSVKQDSVKPEFLSDKVKYKATDYVSINQKEERIYLYNEAEVYYEDMEITAGIIIIDYKKNEVYAGRLKDTLGEYSQHPVFKQGDNLVEPDSIRFNFDTEKALIFNSKTEQSGFNILGERTKKENDSVVFLSKARFTTSEDPENPEYYFQSNKIKFVPKRKIVVGPTNMVIADVPTPIGLPFGFFPLTDKQTSGLIIPTFGEQSSRGYFLQNGGYYFAISDYVDLAVLGDYYTNGSYGFRLESSYAYRYKFSGNLSFRYENLITSERGFPDYANSTIYNIRWSHSQDAKANPNSRFSASVNLGSSRYYQQSVNQLNVANRLNNTLSSSVSYSKTFQGEPQVNMSATVTHSQNTNTETINMTLPTFQGSMSRVFPFAPKTGAKKGIFQNINFQYNLRAENRIQTTDSLFFKKEMFDQAKNGVQHSIPLSTNFKLFKYFSMSASTNYQEVWAFKTLNKTYDPILEEVIETDVKGFDAYRTYNFSTSLGTTIYGMFNFKKEGKDPKIQAIRHVMRPSISYSINPSFDRYYENYEIATADGTTVEEYSRFEDAIFGAPSNRYSSSIGLSLSNNFEAKVKDKDTTATEPKKIMLLNSLNFSTNYNMAADSLNLSPVRMTGGTQFFDNKLGVNFNATLDPYALNSNNQRINTLNINNGGSLFRLVNANISMNYSLTSDSFDSTKNTASQTESARSGGDTDDLFGRAQDFSDKRYSDGDKGEEEETSELYNYKIPWNVRFAYTANYNNASRQNEISSHSLMFSGDVELSKRWSVGASSGYDLKNNGFTYTQLRFERDLLSWRMNFSYQIPATNGSSATSWFFFIGIKSSMLSDIKYEQRRQPDQQL